MIHVSVADRYGMRTFSFGGDAVVIGSAPDADLVLQNSGVARQHIRVARRDNRLYVDDLRGKQPSRPVGPRDRIRVGGIELWVALYLLAPEGVVHDVERHLLEELRRHPGDGELRAVYADWLDEQGHAARAEFLRTQLAVAGAASASDPAFVRASARLAELAPEVGDGWRARVAMSFIERCPTTRRRGEALGFELVCPMRWDKLAATDREGIRFCGSCRREVTYCTSIEQARTIAEEGGCIAVDVATERQPYDLQRPPMVGQPSPALSHYGHRAIDRRDGVVR